MRFSDWFGILGPWIMALLPFMILKEPHYLKLGPGARAAIDIDPPSLVKQLSANDPVLFPKEFFLVFSITNILNVFIPASPALFTLAALRWSWTTRRAVCYYC